MLRECFLFLAMNKLKYKPTITSSIPNYISKANALFERADKECKVQKVEHISYIPGPHALPDIYALALGRCAPPGSRAHTSGKAPVPGI